MKVGCFVGLLSFNHEFRVGSLGQGMVGGRRGPSRVGSLDRGRVGGRRGPSRVGSLDRGRVGGRGGRG